MYELLSRDSQFNVGDKDINYFESLSLVLKECLLYVQGIALIDCNNYLLKCIYISNTEKFVLIISFDRRCLSVPDIFTFKRKCLFFMSATLKCRSNS